MSCPDGIEKQQAPLLDQQMLDIFYKGFGEACASLDWIEKGITLATIPPEKQKPWDSIGSGNRYKTAKEAEQVAAKTEELLRALSSPLLGRKVYALASFNTQKAGVYYEDAGDYGYFPKIEGEFTGVRSAIVRTTTNYPIGYGDHIPGGYPKEGQFEKFRFCFGIGKLFVPVRDISDRHRTLKLSK